MCRRNSSPTSASMYRIPSAGWLPLTCNHESISHYEGKRHETNLRSNGVTQMQNKNTGTLISARTEDFSLREMAAPIFRCKKILIVTLLCSFVVFTAIGLLIFYKF